MFLNNSFKNKNTITHTFLKTFLKVKILQINGIELKVNKIYTLLDSKLKTLNFFLSLQIMKN